MASWASRADLNSEIRNLQAALTYEQTNKRQLADEVETLKKALVTERKRSQELEKDIYVNNEDKVDTLQSALETERKRSRELAMDIELKDAEVQLLRAEHFKVNTLQEALEAEQKRNQDLTAVNDDLLAKNGSKIAIRDEDLDAEEEVLRQRNATLAYDINCLKEKNGRLEKSIEQLHESALLSLTKEDLVGLDLRVPSDNELVSELFALDDSIRSWCEEWISKCPAPQRADKPQLIPFQKTPVRYTLVDRNAHSLPFSSAMVWRTLKQWIFGRTSPRTPTIEIIEMNGERYGTITELWMTQRNAWAFQNLQGTFYNSEKLKSNFEVLNQWRRLTVSLLAKDMQSEHYERNEDTKRIIFNVQKDVLDSFGSTLGIMESDSGAWGSLNFRLSRIIQHAVHYSLKLRLHPKLFSLRMWYSEEAKLIDPPINTMLTIEGRPMVHLGRSAEISVTTRPGLYHGTKRIDEPHNTGISWTTIETEREMTIPIWVYPETRKKGVSK